jgi:hypothetical protein
MLLSCHCLLCQINIFHFNFELITISQCAHNNHEEMNKMQDSECIYLSLINIEDKLNWLLIHHSWVTEHIYCAIHMFY